MTTAQHSHTHYDGYQGVNDSESMRESVSEYVSIVRTDRQVIVRLKCQQAGSFSFGNENTGLLIMF